MIKWILENNRYVDPDDNILSEEVIGLEIKGKEFRFYGGEDEIVVLERYLNDLQVRDLPRYITILPSLSEMINGPVIPAGTVAGICRTEEGLECYIYDEINVDV
ncbi:MAG: hypothetical protein ACOCRK_07340 [bacterium]